MCFASCGEGGRIKLLRDTRLISISIYCRGEASCVLCWMFEIVILSFGAVCVGDLDYW